MKFCNKNDISKFSFKDCVVDEVHISDVAISFVVSGLIVKANNSENANFVDTYADSTNITFVRASIGQIIKTGYRKYDADDRLIEEVPDEELAISTSQQKALFEGCYLSEIQKKEEEYVAVLEQADAESGVVPNEYEVSIVSDELVIEWDRYLNRVQEL